MKYEEIKEWLDFWVNSIEEQRKHVSFNNQICTYEPNNYVFVKCIDQVADVMGMELKENIYAVGDFPYVYSFIYRGVEFLQSYETRLERFLEEGAKDAGTD